MLSWIVVLIYNVMIKPHMNIPLQSRPSSWEVNAILKLIESCRETRCHVHIVHLSASEALPHIEAAKKEGLPLTVETCPHYLCLQAEEIQNKETHFKCAPPIRDNHNRNQLWKGLCDGIIDFIVSDHSLVSHNSKIRYG